MKKLLSLIASGVLVVACAAALAAQDLGSYAQIKIEPAADLQTLVDRAAQDTLAAFAAKGLKPENFAVTLIDLREAGKYPAGSFRGTEKAYPASVIKMFYDVALHQAYADGLLMRTPALDRAEKDMIVVSSNEATQFIVDALTGTNNGAELAPTELAVYGQKRDIVNRYFRRLNYTGINVNQKTYGEDLYGRERQWWNEGKNRNMLTTDATARLLTEIALGRAVSPEHSAQMMELLKRDPYAESKDTDNQSVGYTGIALKDISNARLWSKAGWTATARHDAAYVETADGLKFVLVTFTTGTANEREIIPHVARLVMAGMHGQ